MYALGRLDEAETSFRTAIAIKPDYSEAHNNLGTALYALGQLDEAWACFQRALRLKPDYAECHRHVSQMKKFTRDDPHVDVLRQLSKTVQNGSSKMHICFALAKACEDLKEVDESFALYVEANRLRKAELSYHIDQDRILFDRIKSTFDTLPEVIAEPLRATAPILIVGMPRSGTSLVEQILASHSEVFGAGELETLNTLVRKHALNMGLSSCDLVTASSRITCDYLDKLNSSGKEYRFVIDKMPLNFRWLGFLLLAQPNIKVIHTIRDPVAVCWSNFRLHFYANGLGFAYDLADLADYYRLYLDLMRFWRGRFPGRIYDLNYERLTEHQEQETRRLLNYCGLEWEDRCLEFEKTERAVRTASAAQVRNPIYKGSSQAWRNYECHLEPLLKRLGLARSSSRENPPEPGIP